MQISERVIVGEKIRTRLGEILEIISGDSDILAKNQAGFIRNWVKRQKKTRFYCVTTPSNPSNLLDIYCYASLSSRYYQNFELKIIALASDGQEAISIVQEMAEQVYAKVNTESEKKFGEAFREYIRQF